MSSAETLAGAAFRIDIAAGGATLVLDEAALMGLAGPSGRSADAEGPTLASPFAGSRLLTWLRERIGDGQAIWTLRTQGGDRLNLQISPAGVRIERLQGRILRGDATTKPVHEVRNHLNIVQTTAELLGLTAQKTNPGLGEPIDRILRQIPPMSAALETISARERERSGSRHSVVGYLQAAIERTAWAGRLVVESDSGVAASATYCDAITRCLLEWASHELAAHDRGRITIADAGNGTALAFSGRGIGDWLLVGLKAEGQLADWLQRWEDLDVCAGAWAARDGGGALIGIPR